MTETTLSARFFRDDKGDIVLYQRPNILLTSFLIFGILQFFLAGSIKEFLSLIAFGSGFAWSASEVMSGDSSFRKMLGCIVLIGLLLIAFGVSLNR